MEPLLLADVVQECSGLTPPKSVVSLSAQLCPDTAQIYAAWGAFTAWVAEALAELREVCTLYVPAHVPTWDASTSGLGMPTRYFQHLRLTKIIDHYLCNQVMNIMYFELRHLDCI